jgi:citrate synthase
MNALKSALTTYECMQAKLLFSSIVPFRDAEEKCAACDAKAESIDNEIYSNALSRLNNAVNPEDCEQAASEFEKLGSYRDSQSKKKEADQKALLIRQEVRKREYEKTEAERKNKELSTLYHQLFENSNLQKKKTPPMACGVTARSFSAQASHAGGKLLNERTAGCALRLAASLWMAPLLVEFTAK